MSDTTLTEKPFTGQDLTGKVFGRLTVLGFAGFIRSIKRPNSRTAMWNCRCSKEGNVLAVRDGALKSGNTSSCGCIQKEIAAARLTKHGFKRTHSHHRLYYVWYGMIQRCEQAGRRDHASYYDKGIKVCERWRKSFPDFLTDMELTWKEGLTLERKNSDLGYSPDNVEWVTWGVQQRHRINNVQLTHNGVTKVAADWAKDIGGSPGLIQNRLSRGWSLKNALTVPLRKHSDPRPGFK